MSVVRRPNSVRVDIGCDNESIAGAGSRLSTPPAPILKKHPRGHLSFNLDTCIMQVQDRVESLAVCFAAQDVVPPRVLSCALKVQQALSEIGMLFSGRERAVLVGPLVGLCECSNPHITVPIIPMSVPEREEVPVNSIEGPCCGDDNVRR